MGMVIGTINTDRNLASKSESRAKNLKTESQEVSTVAQDSNGKRIYTRKRWEERGFEPMRISHGHGDAISKRTQTESYFFWKLNQQSLFFSMQSFPTMQRIFSLYERSSLERDS